jgi:hypothetical protein
VGHDGLIPIQLNSKSDGRRRELVRGCVKSARCLALIRDRFVSSLSAGGIAGIIIVSVAGVGETLIFFFVSHKMAVAEGAGGAVR